MTRLPSISRTVVVKDHIPGSIGRKWAIDGVTEIPDHMSSIAVVVSKKPGTPDVYTDLATLHEMGHAEAAVDVARNVSDEPFRVLCAQDRWRGEVEAWMRGLEKHVINLQDAHLILDCLNSYRRGIPATDEQWRDAVDLLGTVYEGDVEDLHAYEPLEPDPGEKPRYCMPSTVSDDGRGDDENDGDGAGGDEEREDPKKGEHDGETKANQYDNGWLRQDVLDEVASGGDLNEIAARNGLDVNRMPPVFKAMR